MQMKCKKVFKNFLKGYYHPNGKKRHLILESLSGSPGLTKDSLEESGINLFSLLKELESFFRKTFLFYQHSCVSRQLFVSQHSYVLTNIHLFPDEHLFTIIYFCPKIHFCPDTPLLPLSQTVHSLCLETSL